jgi:hypothetical protein
VQSDSWYHASNRRSRNTADIQGDIATFERQKTVTQYTLFDASQEHVASIVEVNGAGNRFLVKRDILLQECTESHRSTVNVLRISNLLHGQMSAPSFCEENKQTGGFPAAVNVVCSANGSVHCTG